MSQRSQFVVGHWQRVYRVPRDHPQPEAQRHQLDNLLNDKLIPALAASFSPFLEQQEGVWLINSLETSLTLDSGQIQDVSLAELIGRQINHRLAQIVAAPPDGENVRYFPSRAVFAAQFIRDTLDGSAGGWEYALFEGLRNLPLPQLLREAIIRDGPETARGVIRNLRQTGRWPAVLNALSDLDAEQIWIACTNDMRGNVRATEIEWLVAHWSAAGEKAAQWTNGKSLLQLWLVRIGDSLKEQLSAESADAAASIEAWLAFLDFVESAPNDMNFERLAAGDFAGISAEVREMYGAVLPEIARAARSGAWLEQVTRAVVRVPQAERASDTPDTFASPCAGLFLLLPIMLDLKLPALFEAHAPAPEMARRWLAWVALQCLGGKQAARHSSDPGFLLALGLDEAPTFYADVPPESLRSAFWEWLRAARYASGTQLALSVIEDGTVIHDMRMDYWLAVTEQSDATLAQLADLLEPPQVVWRPGEDAPSDEPGATFARFYKPAQADVDYLRLPALHKATNDLLMPIAQAVLRNFARRQMGFGWSSLAYIQQNMFGVIGQITRQAGRIDIALSDVPLAPVLRMTGLHRDEYVYPWRQSLSIRLLLP
jgi:hypothetical protein